MCARVCVRAYVRACVHACVRMCVSALVCLHLANLLELCLADFSGP